jgi:hypothetical protein
MLATMDGEIRNVNVPDSQVFNGDRDGLLEKVFHYGQNDFQPIPDRCSVSVGDVVLLNGVPFICRPVGFEEITPEELARYEAMDRDQRWFFAHAANK